MTLLQNKKCVPCEGGIQPLDESAIRKYLPEVPEWRVGGNKIKRDFEFKDFVTLMQFVNRMADLAEAEGHHPDFFVSYNKLSVILWTHSINGLSDNDFILARKIDGLG